MKTFKIPFAFDKEGKLFDVKSAKKGVVYYCNCGADVKLRGGDIMSDHFYHVSESECSLESSIHKAYKSVFSCIKTIKLPYDINGLNTLTFDKIELEKQIDDYIPDAIGYIGEDKYLIEFAKTSYIGDRKKEKIVKSNLFCIEVSIIKTVACTDDIENHLKNEKYYKDVIHIPEYQEMKELREKFKSEYLKLKAKHRDEIKEVYDKLHEKYHELEDLKEKEYLFKDFGLFYKADCKNGAKMYKHDLGNGKSITGFLKNNVFSIHH